MRAIRREDVHAITVKLSKVLAPRTVKTTFQQLRTMVRSAIADELIKGSDPTMKIKLPKVTSELIVFDTAEVVGLIEGAPQQFAAATATVSTPLTISSTGSGAKLRSAPAVLRGISGSISCAVRSLRR